MPNHLDLPDDLDRLIEKREHEEDRRREGAPADEPRDDRRRGQDRRREPSPAPDPGADG